jgi:hypothetical protein
MREQNALPRTHAPVLVRSILTSCKFKSIPQTMCFFSGIRILGTSYCRVILSLVHRALELNTGNNDR